MALKTIRGNIAITWDATGPSNKAAPAIVADSLAGYTDVLHGTGSDGECLSSLSGWTKSVGSIDIPDACSMVTKSISGENDLGTGVLTYYLDDTTTPIKDLFTPGTAGVLLFAPYGVTAGQRSTVVEVTVQTNQIDYTVANQGATFTVTFAKSSQTEGRIVA